MPYCTTPIICFQFKRLHSYLWDKQDRWGSRDTDQGGCKI